MDPGMLTLIAAMGAVTYATRLLPLLVPLRGDLPQRANAYLALVAPAVLSALAAVATLIASGDGQASLRLNMNVVPIVLGVATSAWRRNLAVGIGVGVLSAVALRA